MASYLSSLIGENEDEGIHRRRMPLSNRSRELAPDSKHYYLTDQPSIIEQQSEQLEDAANGNERSIFNTNSEEMKVTDINEYSQEFTEWDDYVRALAITILEKIITRRNKNNQCRSKAKLYTDIKSDF